MFTGPSAGVKSLMVVRARTPASSGRAMPEGGVTICPSGNVRCACAGLTETLSIPVVSVEPNKRASDRPRLPTAISISMIGALSIAGDR